MARASLKKETNLIEVPDRFSRLLDISNDENIFQYQFSYKFNPVKLIKNKSSKVQIVVSTQPIQGDINTNIADSAEPQDAIQKIQLRNSKQKDLSRGKNQNIIKTKTSDIIKKVRKDKTINLFNADFQSSIDLEKKRSIVPKKISQLQQNNQTPPILDVDITSKIISSSSDERSENIRKVSNDILISKNIDPSEFITNNVDTIQFAKSSFNGYSNNNLNLKDSNTKDKNDKARLLRDIITETNQTINNVSDLDQDESVNVVVTQNIQNPTIDEIVNIPIGRINANKFYVAFLVKDSKDRTVQFINRAVPHDQNISNFLTPKNIPDIKVSSVDKSNENVIHLKQRDKNATKIVLFKKEKNKNLIETRAGYKKVATINAAFNEGFKIFKDESINSNPVIYRAIASTNDNLLGSGFSSVVLSGKNDPNIKHGKSKSRFRFASLIPNVKSNGIEIRISNIPPDIVYYDLLRRDLSINEIKFTTISNMIPVTKDSDSLKVISDKNVKENRIYEYRIKARYLDGFEDSVSDNIVVEYNPTKRNIMTIEATEPQVIRNSNQIDVQFQLQKSISKTDHDRFKSFLSEQGLTSEFQDEIINNRDKLQQLFAFAITRNNLTTGEKEYFGVLDTSSFSDQQERRSTSVKPLQPGFDYQYEIVAYARDPETVFNTLEKTSEKEGKDFTFKPSKWRHPKNLLEGTIVSEGSLQRTSAKNAFELGDVVDRKFVNVSTKSNSPSINNVKVSKLDSDVVFLQWKYDGNSDLIDHFLILLEINGSRKIIGKTHAFTESNKSKFIHEINRNEVGSVGYIIIPVLFDYSRSSEFKTDKIEL